MVLMEMLTLEIPYKEIISQISLKEKIVEDYKPLILAKINDFQIKDFIKKLILYDKQNRPSISELFLNEFLQINEKEDNKIIEILKKKKKIGKNSTIKFNNKNNPSNIFENEENSTFLKIKNKTHKNINDYNQGINKNYNLDLNKKKRNNYLLDKKKSNRIYFKQEFEEVPYFEETLKFKLLTTDLDENKIVTDYFNYTNNNTNTEQNDYKNKFNPEIFTPIILNKENYLNLTQYPKENIINKLNFFLLEKDINNINNQNITSSHENLMLHLSKENSDFNQTNQEICENIINGMTNKNDSILNKIKYNYININKSDNKNITSSENLINLTNLNLIGNINNSENLNINKNKLISGEKKEKIDINNPYNMYFNDNESNNYRNNNPNSEFELDKNKIEKELNKENIITPFSNEENKNYLDINDNDNSNINNGFMKNSMDSILIEEDSNNINNFTNKPNFKDYKNKNNIFNNNENNKNYLHNSNNKEILTNIGKKDIDINLNNLEYCEYKYNQNYKLDRKQEENTVDCHVNSSDSNLISENKENNKNFYENGKKNNSNNINRSVIEDLDNIYNKPKFQIFDSCYDVQLKFLINQDYKIHEIQFTYNLVKDNIPDLMLEIQNEFNFTAENLNHIYETLKKISIYSKFYSNSKILHDNSF